MNGTVAITMGGLGRRFREAGFKEPKYQIDVCGRPLFDWSMLSLGAFVAAGWHFRFAVRVQDEATPFIYERCKTLNIAVDEILELGAHTDGQATTALMLADGAPQDQAFLVFNIDTFVRPSAMTPAMVTEDCDGWIPCFPGPGDGWSFVRMNDAGAVKEVREKVRISDLATVGLYWFSSASLYTRIYKVYYGVEGREERGERYIAPLYNQLIAEGRIVRITPLAFDDVGMLGTPDQVRAFTAAPPAAARGLL